MAGPKKGVALNGLTFGLTAAADGAAITSGLVTAYIAKDGGTQVETTNSAAHLGNGQWKIDLTATEMNATVVGVIFTHASAVPTQVTLITDAGTDQTGDSYSRIGVAGAGLTALGDTRIAYLDAAITSRLSPAGTLARVTAVDTTAVATTVTNAVTLPAAGHVTPGSYVGGIATSTVSVQWMFTTTQPNGVLSALAGGALRVYRNDFSSYDDASVFLSADINGITGLNKVKITLANEGTPGFYAAGSDYNVVLRAGTVDGVTVIGAHVGGFSVHNRNVGGGGSVISS